jgi:ferredoxin-NADP reductase
MGTHGGNSATRATDLANGCRHLVTRETSSVCTIGLDLPDWPSHRAGQHVDVRLTAEDGYTAEREYSIASAPGEPLAITVERW